MVSCLSLGMPFFIKMLFLFVVFGAFFVADKVYILILVAGIVIFLVPC